MCCTQQKFAYLCTVKARWKALANRTSDFFHNLYIVFPLLFPHKEGFFVLSVRVKNNPFAFADHIHRRLQNAVFVRQVIDEKRYVHNEVPA